MFAVVSNYPHRVNRVFLKRVAADIVYEIVTAERIGFASCPVAPLHVGVELAHEIIAVANLLFVYHAKPEVKLAVNGLPASLGQSQYVFVERLDEGIWVACFESGPLLAK